MKKLLVFASGSPEGGGSGFEQLCIRARDGDLHAEIVGVVSNHAAGGVKAKAGKYGIPFFHMTKEERQTAEGYHAFVKKTAAEFVALSGWMFMVRGLDPQTTFNIHPGPLPRYGGKGMYGHFVHERVIDDFYKGLIAHSAVTMHFADEIYDNGPAVLECLVPIKPDDTAETLGARVNRAEHFWQWQITEKILNGEIFWDGVNKDSLAGKVVVTYDEDARD